MSWPAVRHRSPGTLRRPRRAGPGSAAGFSLLELAAAVLVFGIAALATASGITASISADAHAQEQLRALNLAVAKLEMLKAEPSDKVVNEAPRPVDSGGVEGSGRYRRWVTVEDEAEGPNTRGVTVHVEYRAGRLLNKQVRLYTVFFTFDP